MRFKEQTIKIIGKLYRRPSVSLLRINLGYLFFHIYLSSRLLKNALYTQLNLLLKNKKLGLSVCYS